MTGASPSSGARPCQPTSSAMPASPSAPVPSSHFASNADETSAAPRCPRPAGYFLLCPTWGGWQAVREAPGISPPRGQSRRRRGGGRAGDGRAGSPGTTQRPPSPAGAHGRLPGARPAGPRPGKHYAPAGLRPLGHRLLRGLRAADALAHAADDATCAWPSSCPRVRQPRPGSLEHHLPAARIHEINGHHGQVGRSRRDHDHPHSPGTGSRTADGSVALADRCT
jgi:hypothetical protein